jgi:hypothetical protein
MKGKKTSTTLSPIMIAHTCRSALGDEFMGGTWYHKV